MSGYKYIATVRLTDPIEDPDRLLKTKKELALIGREYLDIVNVDLKDKIRNLNWRLFEDGIHGIIEIDSDCGFTEAGLTLLRETLNNVNRFAFSDTDYQFDVIYTNTQLMRIY